MSKKTGAPLDVRFNKLIFKGKFMSTRFVTINGIVRPFGSNNSPKNKLVETRLTIKKPAGYSHKTYQTTESFTIPNSKCSVCHASVYYYEHPNGSRVFFDELGPPWPVHPCTASGTYIQGKKRQPTRVSAPKSARWIQENWQPLKIEKCIEIQSGSAVQIQASTSSFKTQFELKSFILKQLRLNVYSINQALIQVKAIDSSQAKISINSGFFTETITTPIVLKSQTFSIEPSSDTKNKTRVQLTREISEKRDLVTFKVTYGLENAAFRRKKIPKIKIFLKKVP